MRGLLCLILLGPALAIASVDRGPDIPCAECSNGMAAAPASGWWYNPEESGTGLNIVMQAGLLLGAVYVYAETGEPEWFIFSGKLQADSGKSHSMYLEASLYRFEGGACLGCSYTAPQSFATDRTIRLEFEQRNHGTMTIDGGDSIGIVPLIAGLEATQHFGVMPYRYPDLQGNWVFVFENPAVGGEWGYRSEVYAVTDGSIASNAEGNAEVLTHSFFYYPNLPEVQALGSLRCTAWIEPTTGEQMVPACEISIATFFPGRATQERLAFPIASANIGANRLRAVNPETGITLEAFRIGFD